MAIPPVPAPAADAGVGITTGTAPEAAGVVTTGTAAVPAPAATPPAAAPWAADIAAALAAPDPAAALDEFMRTKQQPYITKLEAERTAALDKAWVFDSFNEDPITALQEVASQVWGDDVGARMAELVAAGVPVEGAQAQAVAEGAAAEGATVAEARAAGTAAGEVDLSKLPADVREAVEFAKSEKAARATAEAEKAAADAQAAAEAEYMEWYGKTVAENADLKGDDPAAKARANALHAYVAAADDMEGGLAAFRADFPAPAAPEAPVTLGGGATTGGIQAARPSGGSFADVMGGVWDAMAGTAPR